MSGRHRWLLTVAVALATAGCGDDGIILATTTSTQDSRLLDELIPAFERDSGIEVKTVAVGSGQAIELGRRGAADVLLVHSPAAEEELMKSGAAGRRRLVMHNDFVVVGPPADPARIRGEPVAAAFERLAAGSAPFVSRGDDSGTHAAELALWEADPSGEWYAETGQGMGATLRIAAERQAYALADRGTFVASPTDLEILVEGDAELRNVYHVIDIPGENEAGGRAFSDWIVGAAAQRTIDDFGREEHGEALFHADAR